MDKEPDDGLHILFQLLKPLTGILCFKMSCFPQVDHSISSGNVGSHNLIYRLAHKQLPPTVS